MKRERVQVLVVGGGGAGLTASMLLAPLGVDALLVSSLPGTSRLPKAHVLNQRAMEIMRDCGADEAIYAIGTPPQQMSHTACYAGFGGHPDAGRVLFKQESWGAGGDDEDWRAASPMVSTNLPQIRLEPLMKARAEDLSAGRIRFHHEVTGVTDVDGGVVATVLDRETGAGYEVEAEYVLACDGGRTIGDLVGITLEGVRDLSRTVTFYLSADLSAWAGDPDVLLRWVFAPAIGKMVVLAPMGPTRWGGESEEWVVHLGYTIDDDRSLDDEAVQADLRAALGIGDHPLDIHLITRWTIGGLVASRFRSGRTFVLGDAAHRHPPTGALGLTSAIHDAHNLCWKIALVLGGAAGDALLDTYEHERRPVDARNVARSLENSRSWGKIGHRLGVSAPGATEADRWASLARLWSGAPADAEFRRDALEMMAGQSQEFHEHDVEYGYMYESSAVVPDGTPPPPEHDFRYFAPSTRPGAPLPHAWIDDWAGGRRSTLDLVGAGRFVLIAGEEGEPWCAAARDVAAEFGIAVDAYRIGHARGDFHDPRLRWQRVREIGPGGAVLVRPDRCVAFRSLGAVERPAAVLRDAFVRVLSLSPRTHSA